MATTASLACILLAVCWACVSATCPCSRLELCRPILDTTRDEVFMFSLHNNENTWSRFNYSKVTTIVMVGYVSQELMCYAHARNTRVVIIANYPKSDLTDATKRQAWIQKQLEIVESNFLDGINIDYEDPIDKGEVDIRNGYTDLVRETFQTFKKKLPYSQVTVDVAWSPACIDDRCYDYKSLAQWTDFLFVMSYDEQSQIFGECVAGANSGYGKTLAGVKDYLMIEGISPRQLVLGLPWYGYLYECLTFDEESNTCHIKHVPFRGVNCSDAAGSQHDYSAIMKQLKLPNNHRIFDQNTKSPFINYKNSSTNKMYQYWYDDPVSLTLKCKMAVTLGLRGVGVWNADSLDYTNSTQIGSMWRAFPDYHR